MLTIYKQYINTRNSEVFNCLNPKGLEIQEKEKKYGSKQMEGKTQEREIIISSTHTQNKI